MLSDLLDKRSKIGREFREYISRDTANDIFNELEEFYKKAPDSWYGITQDDYKGLKEKYLQSFNKWKNYMNKARK